MSDVKFQINVNLAGTTAEQVTQQLLELQREELQASEAAASLRMEKLSTLMVQLQPVLDMAVSYFSAMAGNGVAAEPAPTPGPEAGVVGTVAEAPQGQPRPRPAPAA